MDELDLQQLFGEVTEFDKYQTQEDKEAYEAAMAAELEEFKQLLTPDELVAFEGGESFFG